ncbi:IPT/TIG domain-containing protein [Agromyces sp. NPDC060279]|uniref:IPT/TIG domain-containing protein n=1 Tax=Agromyces sp. NPDC060279 TaxID=3347092 RepID=UPI00365B6265
MVRGLAAGTVALLVVGGGGALGAQAAPEDPSQALGQFLGADLLQLQAADLAYAYASDPGGPPSEADPFDLAVLQALGLQLDLIGNGLVQVPLLTDGTGPGLLNLGEIGVVNSYAGTASTTDSVAASGAVADDGTISVSEDADPADFGNATVNLTDLLDQLGVAAVTDELIDEASLEVGALATRAAKNGGIGITSDYRVTDLGLELSSPAVAGLATQLRGTLNTATTELTSDLEALAGPGGAVQGVVDAIADIQLLGVANVSLGDATIAVTPPNLSQLVDQLLGGPNAILYSDDGAVSVNLTDGTISVDLAELVNPGGPNLNGLPPNTSVLTPEVIGMITDGVNQALGKLVGHLTGGLDALLESTQISLNVGLSVVALPALGGLQLVNAPIIINGTLTQFLNGTATADLSQLQLLPGVPTCLGVEVGGICTGVDINTLLASVLTTVTNTIVPTILAGVVAPIQTLLTSTSGEITTALDGVVDAVLTLLEPALDGLLANLVVIRINEQPTEAPLNESGGDLGPGSFTVRALSVTLLPNVADSDLAKLDLASSTVLAAALPPVITTLSPNQGPEGGGTLVTITGTDLADASQITVDGASVPFTQLSGTQVTFTTAAHAPGPVNVTITTPGGTSNALPFTFIPAPEITSLAPDSGPTAGGTPVTITGTDLGGATDVSVDGTSVAFSQVSGTEVTFTTAPHAAGPVDVTITTPGGTSAPMTFTYVPAPTITSLAPNQGPTAGGTPVTITGTDLGDASEVSVDGASVAFTQVSGTQVTFTTAPHAAGPVDVTITTPGGTSAPMTFTYVPAPVITTLTPDEGPASGGTPVTIDGTDLAGATAVTVDGATVPFTQVSGTQLSFTTPPHAAGPVDVTVTTPGGTSGPLTFTYLPAPLLTELDPDAGPTAGGTPVTITGSDLGDASEVTVDGVPVAFTGVTSSEITIVTPPHAAGPVDVVVTTPTGVSNPLTFTYYDVPVIASLTPSAGPTSGLTLVTVDGTNLAGATGLTVDGASVPFTQVSGTQLTFLTPAHAAGQVDVIVTTPGGASNAMPFTYVPAPVLTALDPDEGPTAGGTVVTITGTDLAGTTEVTVDGASLPFSQVSGTEVSFTTEPHAAGTVNVVVTTTGGPSNALPFTFVPAPAITSLAPDEGPTAGGTLVTITGTALAGATEVSVDGASLAFTQLSGTQVTFTTAAHAAGPVDVTVTTAGGESAPMTFTFVPAPAITSLAPDEGPTAGGTLVTITGTDLAGASEVSVDGTSVDFTQVSGTEVTFTTEPHAAGTVDVTITTAGGESDGMPFTFVPAPAITSLAPDHGPTTGGTPVTITGTDLAGATEVAVDGASLPFTQVSGTEVTFTTAAHAAGPADVTITTAGGESEAMTFTFVPPLGLAALSPDHGPETGGTTVTISGAGLDSTTGVTVDGESVPFTIEDDGTVTFVTPPHAPGLVEVVVTNPLGSESLPFTYNPVTTVDEVDPPTGPEAGGTEVTITGSCFTGATDVRFGGTSATSFTVVSDTEITAVVPAGTGVVDVSVVGVGDCGTGTLPDGYSYLPPVNALALMPDRGPASGGTAVQVTGTGLGGATELLLDGESVPFTQVSDSRVDFVTPPHAVGPVEVTVTAAGGTSEPLTYTYTPAGIDTVTPPGGPSTGGTEVTISGQCFTGATAVKFGSKPASSFRVVDDRTIVAVAPAGTGVVDVTVVGSADCGTATLAKAYTYRSGAMASTGFDAAPAVLGGVAALIAGFGALLVALRGKRRRA